jgi:hypothetical protein
MHEARQAAESSIREIIENAASSRHGRRVSQARGCGEESWPQRFGIRPKEIARSIVSGTRRCISTDTPLSPTRRYDLHARTYPYFIIPTKKRADVRRCAMSAYVRKTRCAVARCPHCSWVEVYFGVDREQLRLRVVAETILHAVTHRASALARRRARKGN